MTTRYAWHREIFRSRLTGKQFDTLTGLGVGRTYSRNDPISRAIGLITSGVVRYEQYSDALSDPASSITFYGEGDLIGLEEALLPDVQGAHYRANGLVHVLQVPYEAFRRFAVDIAPLAVMQEQAARSKKALIDRARVTMSVQDRLGTFLMDLALRFGSRSHDGLVLLPVDLSQDQIAQAIGASRAKVEQELRLLREGGYVWTRYRGLILTEKFMAGGPKGTWCA